MLLLSRDYEKIGWQNRMVLKVSFPDPVKFEVNRHLRCGGDYNLPFVSKATAFGISIRSGFCSCQTVDESLS